MVDSNYSKSTGKFWYFGKVDVHEKWSHGEVRLLHVHVFSICLLIGNNRFSA